MDATNNSSNIAIVTDSTADLPEDLVRRLHIHVIPNVVIIDEREYEDNIDITREEFYKRLPTLKELPTTATASSGSYEALYSDLLERGKKQIVSIHTSSLLSGIFNAASAAAQRFSGRVQVIDSQSISLGLGYQVIAAAEAALSGITFPNLLELIADVRERVRVVAMLDTLEYVRKSGRVSWAQARIGQILKLKPFLEVKAGEVLSLGETRTFRKGLARMKSMLQSVGPLEKLAILHTNAEEEAQRLKEEMLDRIPVDILIVNVTTVIGTHVGPHCLGFAAVLQEEMPGKINLQ